MRSLDYRSDIDGLRAVAITTVVLFHAGIWPFTGGYVGVDVFFVISGYLITSILIADAGAGAPSILRFYERRIRRIFPALFAMLLFVLVAGLVLFMPFDLRRVGMQTVAATAFASNVLFWLQAGYFDASAVLKPLLHTWSLAVEEQYYFAYPLLVAAVMRRAPHRLFHIVAGIAAASFVIGIAQLSFDPIGAFYLPLGRAWQLMLGGMLALRPPAQISARVAHTAGLAGLALIVWSAIAFTAQTPFPGLNALAPCIGAALIIASGHVPGALAARLLSLPAIVGLGLISYSLYLWHWPLIVFARYALMREMTAIETAGIMALSIGAAWASWRYVEQPFRRPRAAHDPARSRAPLFAAAAGAMALSIAAGLALFRLDGLPGRLSPAARDVAVGAFDTALGRSACDRKSAADIAAGNVCTLGEERAEPSFAVLADSIGIAMLPGIDAAARAAGRRGLILTQSGCYPLLGVRNRPSNTSPRDACSSVIASAVELVKSRPAIGTVMLIGRWANATEGSTFGVDATSDWFILDQQTREPGYDENRRVFQRGIIRTADALAGRRLVIVHGLPEQRFNVPRSAGLARHLGRLVEIDVTRTELEARQAWVRAAVTNLRDPYKLQPIDLTGAMCSEARCPATRDGRSLYSDDNHLTRYGALALAPVFARVLGRQ